MNTDEKETRISEPWHGPDWEDASERTLTMALKATAAQRLQWLEEMIAIAHQSGALPRRDFDE